MWKTILPERSGLLFKIGPVELNVHDVKKSSGSVEVTPI